MVDMLPLGGRPTRETDRMLAICFAVPAFAHGEEGLHMDIVEQINARQQQQHSRRRFEQEGSDAVDHLSKMRAKSAVPYHDFESTAFLKAHLLHLCANLHDPVFNLRLGQSLSSEDLARLDLLNGDPKTVMAHGRHLTR
jgi:hypothetical protein